MKVVNSLENIKTININNLSAELLFNLLFNDGGSNVIQKGQAFSQGVTFTDIDSNCVVSSKYVFFIGAN